MSGSLIAPPPPSLLANRELYLYLLRIHDLLNGTDSSLAMSADLASGAGSQAIALADRAASDAESAMLMPAPHVGPTKADVEAAMLSVPVRQGLTPADLQSSQLAAMRGQMSALQSQLDAVALMSRPAVLMQQFRAISVSAAYYVKPWEFVDVNATGGAVTVTLSDAASNVGKLCGVAKNDASANNVTVSGAINGAASATITVQYTALLFISIGTEWRLW